MQETYEFQTEINRLLFLIINAMYSKKEVAVRELISNASDALNKLRHQWLTDSSSKTDTELFVRLITDKESNTLTFWDSGVGMTRDELQTNLGTIAHSGTKSFMDTLAENKNMNDLIGQFGIGFYSSFLIAKRVDVYSRSYNSPSVFKWSSDATNKYTLEEVTNDTLTRGTIVVLHLKDDCLEYLEENRLKSIINEHSSFISFPIELQVTHTEEKSTEENPTEENSTEEKSTSTYTHFERVNTLQPLWTRDPKEITQEEHNTFYKSISNDWEGPLTHVYFRAEGSTDFRVLAYIPKRAPYDMFREKKEGSKVHLYVRRVSVKKHCEEIIPEYLNFVAGVVDSDDLPLNVSREMLQENKIIKTIRKQLTKKTLEALQNLSETDYETFYKQFNKNIKLGVHSDTDNKDRLANLLRYHTLNHQDTFISLQQYVTEMPESQKHIYYITGSQKHDLVNSPFVEGLKKRGIDLLLMYEPIDEYVVQGLTSFSGKELQNVTKEGLQLDDNNKDLGEHTELFEYVKNVLGNKVSKVNGSTLLDESPCIISSQGMSANMERILKSQALQDDNMLQYMKSGRSFELNTNHKLVQYLEQQVLAKTTDRKTDSMVNILYDTALLSSGYVLENTQNYSKRVYNMLEMNVSVSELVEVADPVHTASSMLGSSMPPYIDQNDSESSESAEVINADDEISDIEDDILNQGNEPATNSVE